jgi:hypothetical protein
MSDNQEEMRAHEKCWPRNQGSNMWPLVCPGWIWRNQYRKAKQTGCVSCWPVDQKLQQRTRHWYPKDMTGCTSDKGARRSKTVEFKPGWSWSPSRAQKQQEFCNQCR